MKAVVVQGVNQVVVQDVPEPTIYENQVLVKMGLTNICSQTDLHMIQGRYDCQKPYPYILGHEGAGTVVQVGEALQHRFEVGDRVAYKGMYGVMAEYTALPEDALFKIPNSVSFETAAMYEVAACAYAIVKQTVNMGDNVLLLGQGCAGLLGTIFAKIAGAALVVASDISSYKRSLAEQYGAHVVVDPTKDDLTVLTKELTSGQGFDVTLDFAGIPQTMNTCVELLRPQGSIGMFGVSCEPFAFDFFKLHDKMGIIITAGHEYNYGSVPFQKMLNFTLSGQLQLEAFVTHKFPLDEMEKGLTLIRNQDETVLRIGLLPPFN